MSRKARFSLSLLGLAFGLLAACAPSMVVNSEGDEGDADLSNADCATVNNECTLRAAIQQANASGNGAIITFENVSLITPGSALPALTDNAIRIRGEGNVTLDGAGAGASANGINIKSSYNEIQGMTIINFDSAAIRIDAFNNETKSNIIGISPNSSADPTTMRNVLGGNCFGVYITGEDAFGNTVAGNYIGTLADGSTANPNTCDGIVIIHGHNNVIGGVSTFVPEIDPSGQEAYWSLDDVAGNRADSVGANTLVETSGTIDQVAGKVNFAADFERNDTEFFEITDNPELSTGDIDFTLAGWAKLESEEFQTLVSKYEGSNNYEYRLFYHKNLDRLIFNIYDAAGQIVGSVNNGTAISANTWYYIVVWHDSVNNVVGMQINNAAASTSATTGAPSDTMANFRMGADSAAAQYFLDGTMDEWGFWKRLLTSQEKDTLYNNGNGYELQLIEQGSNIISGNDGPGIYLGHDATDNIITGNYIGTAKDGKTPLGNTSTGIYLTTSSHNNIIGLDVGGFGGAPNVISANGESGISVQTNNNLIAGNFIGTDITGTMALGNGQNGIFVHTATGNVIGTNGDGVGDDQEGNVISGNGVLVNRAGIWLIGVNNVIAGNMIGTNVDGTAALGNSGSGITLGAGGDPGFSNRIGTNGDGVSDQLEGNLISGNGGSGVFLGSYQNQVSGNLIGTTADGMSALGNGASGVAINLVGHTNLIGTNGDGVADAAERNVISANGFAISGGYSGGVALYGPNNVVAGNYIGINAAGTGALGNSRHGVVISRFGNDLPPQGNLIGTDGDGVGDAAEANVISGNGWSGVSISFGSNNQVSGNFIGTDASGMNAIPNSFDYIGGIGAVDLGYGASGNVIGTNGDGVGDAAERNVISGNARFGINLGYQQCNNNIIAGNYIGTNAAGTGALGNSLGIHVGSDATGNRIGTNGDGLSDALEANVISANQIGGIVIIVASSNEIAGNFIGTDKNGTADLGNGQEGIEINASNIGGTNGNTVGGSPEKANVIAYNDLEGVEISGIGTYPVNTPILYNSIFENGSLGINLQPTDGFYGITLNDVGDADIGANNLTNFPELDFALTLNNSITITGEIVDGLPNTSFLIQFFSNTSCDDPSGHGEGQTFIGESTEMTNGSGDVSFLASFNVTVAAGEFITATATTSNNTSEFSECIEVVQGSQLSSTGQAPPIFQIVPLRDINCRYYCTAQSDIADTLLVGIEYIPIGWDPEMGFFAFAGPTFGEICFAPPRTGGTELMTLQLNNQEITFEQLTLDDLPLFACPAFSTPTPTADIDEGANPTETPRAPQCSDGIDNDGDGLIDYSATGGGDPQCRNASDNDELNP